MSPGDGEAERKALDEIGKRERIPNVEWPQRLDWSSDPQGDMVREALKFLADNDSTRSGRALLRAAVLGMGQLCDARTAEHRERERRVQQPFERAASREAADIYEAWKRMLDAMCIAIDTADADEAARK